MMSNTFEQIRKVVKQIPPGMVSTYGDIARKAGFRNPRIVGWAMRGNKDSDVPCHRVVMKDGTLAKNFSFDGWIEQKLRLEEEGVEFLDGNFEIPKVDMERFLCDLENWKK